MLRVPTCSRCGYGVFDVSIYRCMVACVFHAFHVLMVIVFEGIKEFIRIYLIYKKKPILLFRVLSIN